MVEATNLKFIKGSPIIGNSFPIKQIGIITLPILLVFQDLQLLQILLFELKRVYSFLYLAKWLNWITSQSFLTSMKPFEEIELLNKLGEGAYGSVYQARIIKTGETVAVKSIKITADEEGVSSTTLREMTILQNLDHPNIVKLLSQRIDYKSVEPKAQLVFEYMDQDLAKRLRGSKKPNATEVKNIMRQILLGVQYMHLNNVFHRDLKPHNILISYAGTVKIADFGLSRIIGAYLETMSKEIQTLWYRSPELLLGTTKYNLSVDVWSLGCIFYEISEYKVLFQTESQIGQIMEIFRQCGTPHISEWQKITSLPNFKPTFPKFIKSPRTYKHLNAEGVDLLERMIIINPEQRITVDQALEHDYFRI